MWCAHPCVPRTVIFPFHGGRERHWRTTRVRSVGMNWLRRSSLLSLLSCHGLDFLRKGYVKCRRSVSSCHDIQTACRVWNAWANSKGNDIQRLLIRVIRLLFAVMWLAPRYKNKVTLKKARPAIWIQNRNPVKGSRSIEFQGQQRVKGQGIILHNMCKERKRRESRRYYYVFCPYIQPVSGIPFDEWLPFSGPAKAPSGIPVGFGPSPTWWKSIREQSQIYRR